MSLRSGLRQLRCLLSAFGLCLFTGPLATTDSIASDEPASTHHHERSAATQHEPVYEKLPPSGLSPEEDLEYSRFMHHSSGVTVLVIGALLLLDRWTAHRRSEEHTSELQSRLHLVCRLLLEKKNKH